MPADAATLRRWATAPSFAVLLSAVIFSVNFVIGRGIHEDCPPIMLGFSRWAGAALILLPFTWRRVAADWARVTANLTPLCVLSALMPVGSAMVGYIALTSTLAVNAAIVQAAMPVLTVVFSWLWLKDRLSARQAGGLALALVGVLGIVIRGDPAVLGGLGFNRGDLLMLFSTACLAVYTVVLKRLPVSFHPLTLLTVVCALGGAFHLPFLAWEMLDGRFLTVNRAALGGILFVAVFPSILAIMFWHYGIEKLGPNRTNVFYYLVPVFTAALGYAFLGEAIAWFHAAGAVLIVAGLVLISGRPGAAAAPPRQL